MNFDIRRAKNGYILKIKSSMEEDGVEEVVYQEKFDNEVDGFAEFLWWLTDNYGPTTNRYSDKRIHIEVRPGDKYEPPKESAPTKKKR